MQTQRGVGQIASSTSSKSPEPASFSDITGAPETIMLSAASRPIGARQTLRAARARQDAELHFRQRDLRAGRGDPVMRAEREFQPAAHGDAMDRRDDRLRASLDEIAYRRQVRGLRRFSELSNVGTGDEVAPRADDHRRRDGRIRVGSVERFDEAAPDIDAERIDGRIVDDDDEDVAVQFPCHRGGCVGSVGSVENGSGRMVQCLSLILSADAVFL